MSTATCGAHRTSVDDSQEKLEAFEVHAGSLWVAMPFLHGCRGASFGTIADDDSNRADRGADARTQLADFFSPSLGLELGNAIAQAKSVPFLETQGMRLVYLLPDAQIPAQITFSQHVAEHRQIVLSQAEVLLKTDEASVVSALADDSSFDVAGVTALLGRFTQARLEYATQSEDAQVGAQSKELLNEIEAATAE